jgi:hypothetical protein
MRVSKSQIAFCRSKDFAWVWIPDRYLHGRPAPLVLSLSFAERNNSPRWKEIVEPYPGRFMHHLELRSEAEIDGEVKGWIREAWEAAAQNRHLVWNKFYLPTNRLSAIMDLISNGEYTLWIH